MMDQRTHAACLLKPDERSGQTRWPCLWYPAHGLRSRQPCTKSCWFLFSSLPGGNLTRDFSKSHLKTNVGDGTWDIKCISWHALLHQPLFLPFALFSTPDKSVSNMFLQSQAMQAEAGTCATAAKSPKLEPNWPWSHQADGSRDGSRGASGSSKWCWLCHCVARDNNFSSNKIRLKQNRDKSLVNMPEKYTGHFGPAKNASVWAGGVFNQHTATMPRDLETASCSKLHFPVSNLSTWQLLVFHWLT